MDEPGGAVIDAQVTLERQGRQHRLGPADQVDRQEPGLQRQLRAVQDGAGGQRGLMSARFALVQRASLLEDELVIRRQAPRAAIAVRQRAVARWAEHRASEPKRSKNAFRGGNLGWSWIRFIGMAGFSNIKR